jgi:hypothetical protein
MFVSRLLIALSILFASKTCDGQFIESFAEVAEAWKRVSQTPLYGETIIHVDTTGGVSFPAQVKEVHNFVGRSGFLTIIHFIDPPSRSSVRALNPDYVFSLSLIPDSPPLVNHFLWTSELRESSVDSKSSYEEKFEQLYLHPALFISESVPWLRIIQSSGFHVSEIDSSGLNDGKRRFHFSCNPTAEESTGKLWIPVITEGILETGGRAQNFLPIQYSFKTRRFADTPEALIKIENRIEQAEDRSWRMVERKQERTYKGRIDKLEENYRTISLKTPSDREFRLSRFGLKEPGTSLSGWTTILAVGFSLFVLVVGSKFYLTTRKSNR